MATKAISLKEKYNRDLSLEQAVRDLIEFNNFTENSNMPWLIWLLENPKSLIRLPGKINLYNHDCLHILLDRNCELMDEAFVIGFTMGNDSKTKWFHLLIYKFFARFLYPLEYRFYSAHLQIFDLAFIYGKTRKIKNLNQINFKLIKYQTVQKCRNFFGINLEELNTIKKVEQKLLKQYLEVKLNQL